MPCLPSAGLRVSNFCWFHLTAEHDSHHCQTLPGQLLASGFILKSLMAAQQCPFALCWGTKIDYRQKGTLLLEDLVPCGTSFEQFHLRRRWFPSRTLPASLSAPISQPKLAPEPDPSQAMDAGGVKLAKAPMRSAVASKLNQGTAGSNPCFSIYKDSIWGTYF